MRGKKERNTGMWLDFTNKDKLEFSIKNSKAKKSYDLDMFVSNKDAILDTIKAIGFNVYSNSILIYLDKAELEYQLKVHYKANSPSTATLDQLKVINVSFGMKYFMAIPEIRNSVTKACRGKYISDMGKYTREKDRLGAKYKSALRMYNTDAYNIDSALANRAVGEAYLAFKECPEPTLGGMLAFNSYTVHFYDLAEHRIDESKVQFHYINCGTEEAAKYFRTTEKIIDFKLAKSDASEPKKDVFEVHGFSHSIEKPVDKLVDMESKARSDFWFPEGVR